MNGSSFKASILQRILKKKKNYDSKLNGFQQEYEI